MTGGQLTATTGTDITRRTRFAASGTLLPWCQVEARVRVQSYIDRAEVHERPAKVDPYLPFQRCLAPISTSVSVRENRHQSGGLLNLLGMTESFSSDFSG